MAGIKKRRDGKHRARYRDEAGREHAKHFERRVDAQQWLHEQTAAIVTGQFVDPKAGKITFARYFEDVATRQVWVSAPCGRCGWRANSATFHDVQRCALRRLAPQ